MPGASPDDAVNAKCPNNKPHKCPPHSTCYGSWEYCSPASKSTEPCVSETVLENLEHLKKLCSDIAQGVNVTKQIRHPSCNVEADCRAQFTSLFLQPSTQKDETSWMSTYILVAVCALVIVLAVIYIIYTRNKAKNQRLHKEQLNEIVVVNNDEVNILQNNRINESRQENNQRQQSTDHESGDMDDTEETSLMRRDTHEATNAQNSPDSGITPDSTAVTINTDSSSGSASNRNSIHSSHNSSASIGSVVQEENLHRSTSWGTHPADRENSHLRALHMPSSEPLDSTQLVTNQTTYNQTNNRGLE